MTDPLVQFLNDRLDEDEQTAREARQWADREWHVVVSPRDSRVTVMDEGNVIAWTELDGEPGSRIGALIAQYDPARARAEVDAKRRIIVEHATDGRDCRVCAGPEVSSDDAEGNRDWSRSALSHPCPTLFLLALPYRDHPDYRAEWAPEE